MTLDFWVVQCRRMRKRSFPLRRNYKMSKRLYRYKEVHIIPSELCSRSKLQLWCTNCLIDTLNSSKLDNPPRSNPIWFSSLLGPRQMPASASDRLRSTCVVCHAQRPGVEAEPWGPVAVPFLLLVIPHTVTPLLIRKDFVDYEGQWEREENSKTRTH